MTSFLRFLAAGSRTAPLTDRAAGVIYSRGFVARMRGMMCSCVISGSF